MLPKISESEYRVMEIVWDNFPINTNEITEILLKKTNWSEKTIQTLISRLVKKGALSYIKRGRCFVYSPLLKKEEYISQESKSFLNRFYNGTLNLMVSKFLEGNNLTDNEIEELKNILNSKTKEK